MTVCAAVDPGGDIPSRVIDKAIEAVTNRMRNIADTFQTHRKLVDRILTTQSSQDDDTLSKLTSKPSSCGCSFMGLF